MYLIFSILTKMDIEDEVEDGKVSSEEELSNWKIFLSWEAERIRRSGRNEARDGELGSNKHRIGNIRPISRIRSRRNMTQMKNGIYPSVASNGRLGIERKDLQRNIICLRGEIWKPRRRNGDRSRNIRRRIINIFLMKARGRSRRVTIIGFGRLYIWKHGI